MEEDLENPTTTTTTPPDDIDSCCSTPYVSAPSSPGRAATGFYYSAPTSPMHFALSSTTTSLNPYTPADASFEFDFSATLPSSGTAASADELFFNGQIRPMKLSTHLQRPQFLTPLIESDDIIEEVRGRDPNKFRAGSLRRRTRSMSPNRVFTTSFQWNNHDDENNKRNEEVVVDVEEQTTPYASRSSSAGRSSSSKKWVFLKELLYRSKSEGRNDGHKFWGTMSFSPAKEKKLMVASTTSSSSSTKGKVNNSNNQKKKAVNKNGLGKRNSPSPHELHYTAKRAQAEEMRKKTFLPYRQGLLGCLGFNSKSYGAINGFARAFNHVSSS
ncbi:hypothetical protein ACJIZ3_015920 [Penstemon smallii]|uniref:Calmodulin-binding protein n=1 Tax=Penstemon smallii TaxID=265156 RepID=A0ABD3RNW0_9LAMI